MKDLLLLFWVMLPVDPGLDPVPLIRKIEVEGNLRVPAASILHAMSSRSQAPLDQMIVARDVRALYSTRLFRDVDIRVFPAAGRDADLIVRVRERPFIAWFSIEGVDEKLRSHIQELLRNESIEFRPATPYDPASGAKAARTVRSWLATHGYPLAEVVAQCDDKGTVAVVRLQVWPGPHIRVSEISFTGNNSIPSDELRSVLRKSRPSPWWAGRYGGGYYDPRRLDADLDCIRRHYRSRGFAAVTFGKPGITVQSLRPAYSPQRLIGGRFAVHVDIPVIEGGLYFLRSVDVEGDVHNAANAVGSIAGAFGSSTRYNLESLEAARQQISDALGRAGYPFARVELVESVDEQALAVRAIFRISAGDPALIGRVEFGGIRRLPDKFLRRELRIGEGQVFDSSRIDQSIRRLNRSGLIEVLRREDLSLRKNPATGAADLTFRVKEKPPQGIYGTGGTVGAAGGYLGVFYTAFNLLGLGERLSLQLDGGAASSNLLLTLAGQHFLGTPFTLGLSVFERYSGINVAGIVPDASDLVRLLTDRRKGARLSGSYSIDARSQAGIGLQIERANSEEGRGNASRIRSELSPAFVYDSTVGTGSTARGFRFSGEAALSYRSFMRSAESVGASADLTRHLADPWTAGRNLFVLDLNLAVIRPTTAGGIAPEKRLYPGGEILRGFRDGGLGSWALGPHGLLGGLKPAGADTVASVSGEYRVPLAGPLSGAAFLDLGWTRLDPMSISEPGLRLIGATNATLRASTGGELRLSLPVINQPARLIFSWNPIRLTRILREGASIRTIADPHGLVRFAVGGTRW